MAPDWPSPIRYTHGSGSAFSMSSARLHRREFSMLLCGTAGWAFAARAQQPAVAVVGYLSPGSRESDAFRLMPFRQGLGAAGYIEGQNLAIEYRWAEGRYDRLPALAADLVRHQVAV